MLVQQAFMKFHLHTTTMYPKKQGLRHEMHHKESVSWDYALSSFSDAKNSYIFWGQYWTVRTTWILAGYTWTKNIYCFRKMWSFCFIVITQKNTSIIKCIVQDILRGMFFTRFNKQMFPMIVAFNAHHAKFLTNSVFPHGYNWMKKLRW